MDPQLLYQEDITKLQFEATVVEILTLPDQRFGVVLDHTYFYPTGGGQEHDTGVIDTSQVIDVFMDEENHRLVHVVDNAPNLGSVSANVYPERRLRHMQNHTAQHLLTQCILRLTGYDTVSANINGYSPSSLDIVSPQINIPDLEQAELLANQVIYENRTVKVYFASAEELQSIPLRRPPKVIEHIRIVEIEGYDYSPCGGTHVLQTGTIGLLKVLKSERQNEKTRIYFVAGLQAFNLFRQMYDSLTGLATKMSTGWQDIPELMSKQSEQITLLQKEILPLRRAGIKLEVQELAARAEERQGFKIVQASFENRPVPELRMLAEELKGISAVVSYLASFDGKKLSLIVTCAEDTGMDARQVLNKQLVKIGGRGGGDARLAQGGGLASQDQFNLFLQPGELD